MAVEHNMADLNTTWWDLLQKIAFNLNWSYAALWTLTADGRNLIWKEGYFHMRNNDGSNAELFHSLYSSCTFTPGVGFAGHALAHMTNSILWLSGDGLDSLEHPVPNQTRFFKAASIQTVVCLPLGLPSSSYVLELGTVSTVRETEDLAHDVKRVLLHLLAEGLPHLINDKTPAGITQQPSSDLFRGQMRALHDSPHPTSSVAITNETLLESAKKYVSNFSPSSFEGGTHPKAQRQLGPNVYSELLQSIEHEDASTRQPARGNLNVIPSQVSVEVPELPISAEPSHEERLTSPWATLNSFPSWTSMAEATSTPDVTLRGLHGSSSATSSRLAEENVDLNDEIEQLVPFPGTLEQFMAADDQQHQQSLLGTATGASVRGSSSRSSMSLRSQNVEDNEISSAILESYADCHISDLENVPRGGGTGGSSSTTMPGEYKSNWSCGNPRASGPSSKETSPDSNVPPPRHGYGIHPRISSTTSSSQKQQQWVVDMKQQHGCKSAEASQPQGIGQSERPHSSILERNPQEEDLKPGPSPVTDSTPRLVQFGNVLQLGNAAGQVTEALPQEHDEAAVSHMLAERRRRNKQNENFSQLKFLIPSAGKMDKASVLAATIAYIHELKERVRDLEQSNQSLTNQLLSVEQGQSSTVGPLISTKAKGSPSSVRVRTPNSLSPTDEDKIQVSLEGDGNLTIEIRNPCCQPDIATHIFACLNEKHLKVINCKIAVCDNRIHASIIVKMKRKNAAGQSAVCAEVEQALTACLHNIG